MTTAIELAERRKVELSYLQTVGTVLAESHYFADAHTAQQAVAKILAGQEFGMGVMEAMRSFHVIDGKVEMSADAQARLVKESKKYDYSVLEITDEVCEIQFYADLTLVGTSRFTMADADRAGIVKDSGAWKKYPRNMLFARALTNGVAWFCPDAIAGGRVYAPGEVSDEVWDVQESPDVEPVSKGPSTITVDGKADGDGPEGSNLQGEVAESSGPTVPGSEPTVTTPGGDSDPGGAGEADREAVTPASDTGEEGLGLDEAPSTLPPRNPSEDSKKDSLIKQILRLQHDARWSEDKLFSYVATGDLREASLESLRFIISELKEDIEASKVTKEQKDKLRALATPSDVIRAAQVYISGDIRSVNDLTSEEAYRLIAALEAVRAEQAVTA